MNKGKVKVSHVLLKELTKEDKSTLSIFPKGTKIIESVSSPDDFSIEYLVEGECVPKKEDEEIPELECFIHTDNKGNFVSSQFILSRRF